MTAHRIEYHKCGGKHMNHMRKYLEQISNSKELIYLTHKLLLSISF